MRIDINGKIWNLNSIKPNIEELEIIGSFLLNELSKFLEIEFQKANKGKFASSKEAAEAYKVSPSRIARSWQGKGNKDITLKKGNVIYRGAPYGTEYFTTKSAVERSKRDATKLFEGLQVSKHPVKGYRPQVTGY